MISNSGIKAHPSQTKSVRLYIDDAASLQKVWFRPILLGRDKSENRRHYKLHDFFFENTLYKNHGIKLEKRIIKELCWGSDLAMTYWKAILTVCNFSISSKPIEYIIWLRKIIGKKILIHETNMWEKNVIKKIIGQKYNWA